MQEKRKGETMQATQERKATHNAIRIMSALAIVTWLAAGCSKAEKTEPPAPEAPQPVEAEQWEPETLTPTNATDDHGHEGHDHGPGGHTH